VSYELVWLVVDTWTDRGFLTARAYAIMPFVWSIGTIIGPGKLSIPLNFLLLHTS
jgi:hypothetical protein